VDIRGRHRVCNTLLFCLDRAIRHVAQHAHKHLFARGRDGKFDPNTINVDAGDGIGEKVEVNLIEESGGPDRAVEHMGVWRGVNGHLDQFLDLVSPCCGEGKVCWESGEGEGEEDGWERCFWCQTQEHSVRDGLMLRV